MAKFVKALTNDEDSTACIYEITLPSEGGPITAYSWTSTTSGTAATVDEAIAYIKGLWFGNYEPLPSDEELIPDDLQDLYCPPPDWDD